MAHEPLYIYLAMSKQAIRAALVRKENGTQLLFYYVSKRLVDVETYYPMMEKLANAFVVNSRKLQPYFQAHHIHVLMDQPLKQLLQKPETSGKPIKWTIKLSQFEILYTPCVAIKGQVLVDFITEFTIQLVEMVGEELLEVAK